MKHGRPLVQADTPQKRARVRVRWQALTHYGGNPPKCACCGESRHEFLAIDHKRGDGAAHRREVGADNINYWLRAHGFPKGFQVLCHNCNFSRGAYGYCPHKRGSRVVVIAPTISERVQAVILQAAQRLWKRGVIPSANAVCKEAGKDPTVVCRHRRVLLAEGRWPAATLIRAFIDKYGRKMLIPSRTLHPKKTRGTRAAEQRERIAGAIA